MKNTAISDKARALDERNSWGTPKYVFDYFNKRFDFNFDAAASVDNQLCEEYWTIDNSWLTADRLLVWSGAKVWCNPPYSNIKPWVEQARADRELGILTALLVPSTPDAGWWPLDASEYIFITNGRLAFNDPITRKPKSGNAKGSVLIVFIPFAATGIVKFLKRDDMK